MNPDIDAYINQSASWREEMRKLRTIVLDCKLTEEVKWGVPCYTSENRNVVLIHQFKEYCALLFFKGVLLTDTHGILVQQTRNVQATRQVRFTQVSEITRLKSVLKTYIKEAIAIENAGLKVVLKKTEEFTMPVEFQQQLNKKPALKKAFEALTPGRQRAYLLHFSAAKQAKTREARVEKWRQHILDGKGLNDS